MKRFLTFLFSCTVVFMTFGCPDNGTQPCPPCPTCPPTATAIPPTETPVPPTEVPTSTPIPPTATAIPPTTTKTPVPPTETPTTVPTNTAVPSPIPPTETPVTDPCAECPDPNGFSCQMWPAACAQCWANCGQPLGTPTPVKTPTRTPTITPTPDPSNPCPQCPDPNGFSCQMWPEVCYQCWAACGHPLATPTPTRTATPRPPTPTSTPNDHPLLSFNYEWPPIGCDLALLHEDSGAVKTITVADCSSIELTFDRVGLWQIQMTAQYAHGWAMGQTEEVSTTEDKMDPLFVTRIQGDVDNDGKYEHVYIRKIRILPRTEVSPSS